ncbi:MAG: TonB-dependent receptor [Bacteroidales bacterium]|nr:TonB-dependent receptor [Bacteroidales bacterium]
MERRILSLLIFSIFMLFQSIAIAQNVTYSGKVVDDNGESIIGVNIIIKGTTQGTITDFDGNFSFQPANIPESPVLVFSFMGHKKQEVDASIKNEFNIVLVEDTEMLDEFVVVGYGIQKKSDVTGAVSTLKSDDLTKIAVPDVSQAMQGLAAGVNVTQNTGAPGEGVKVQIRGVGSVTGETDPLYIVDGVPTKDAMNSLSTADIKSISVLKDAASAAIYGSRANNGVVLITTNKGSKNSPPQISFNARYGVQRHGQLPEMTDKYEYAEVFNEAADNFNKTIPDNPELWRSKITDEILNNTPNINHVEAIFRPAHLSNFDLGVSGGTEKTQYNISGSYFGQEGILIGSDYKKITGKISLTSDVKDWLVVGTNINISKDETNIVGSSGDGYGGNGGSAVRYAFFRNPMTPIYDESDEFVDLPEFTSLMGDGYNPVGLLKNTANIKNAFSVFGDINTTVKISDDLNLVSILGVDKNDYKQRRFNKNWGTNDRINAPNSLNVIHGSSFNWIMSHVLNYYKVKNDIHNFNVILGAENVNNQHSITEVFDRDFPDQNPVLVYLGNGLGIMTTNESKVSNNLLSYFSRVNYNLKAKYYLSGLIRRDGSSKFSANNRWGTFYSMSFGWRIDKDFFADSKVIDQWKLRVSYGSVGNQEIPDFAYLERLSSGYQYPFGYTAQEGYATYKLRNADVQWETSNQIDIGNDMYLFSNRLELGIDYYYKTTDNLLLGVSLPSSAGYAEPPILNTGKILNSGLEFTVGFRDNISKDFSYYIRGNGALLYNEMLELENPILAGRIDNGVYATKTEEGHPIGSFYLYEMEGIFQNEYEVVTHAKQDGKIMPGDVKYKDQNGDNVINSEDKVHMGSAIPKVTLGLNIGFTYKQIDFSLFADGAFGQKLYYQIATDIEGFYRPFNLTQSYYNERWTGEGTSNTQPRASWEAKSNNARPSTRFLKDASYLKIKNVQIGYSFPKEMLKKIKLSKLRVYCSGTNLYTLTKYPGLDPELTTSDNTLDSSEAFRVNGIDWGTYPSAFTISLGVQVKFLKPEL